MPGIANHEVQSEEVSDVLNQLPRWTVRWGTTFIFITLLLMLLGSALIDYPDTITAHVILYTQVPPASLIARENGNVKLLVRNEDPVREGQALGFIENAAAFADVCTLKEVLAQMQADPARYAARGARPLQQAWKLGKLHPPVLLVARNLHEYQVFRDLNSFKFQRGVLLRKRKYYDKLDQLLANQLELLGQQYQIEKKGYEVDSVLYAAKHKAELEVSATKLKLLGSRNKLEEIKQAIVNNQIIIEELNGQANDLLVAEAEKRITLLNNITESMEALEGEISDWEQRYVFKAPIAGRTSLSNYWTDNLYAAAGEEVMVVVPDAGPITGQLKMPIAGSGKVETGQKVQIRFDNYPYQEYGFVTGFVQKVSKVPTGDAYTITVGLPNHLRTTYNKELAFRQKMQGTAEIITADLSLLQRITHQFYALVDKM